MEPASCQINLVVAWLAILAGLISGLVLGMFFHREGWLGGYAAFRRRLYRLAHVSFFGLGAANLLFYLTAQAIGGGDRELFLASRAFVIGAASMPICCVLMAHFPRIRLLFGIPVLSLIAGGTLTLWEVLKS